MKKLFSVLFLCLFAQYAMSQDFVTVYRTSEEEVADIWDTKIIDEQEVDDYILQLVASKEENDYASHWLYLQVLDKATKQPLQQLEIDSYGIGDSFRFGDFNFDGHTDFSLLEGYGVLDNSTQLYFLFDPQTKTFDMSDIYGSNLEFDDATQTITSSSRCCAGSEGSNATYCIVDNKMVLIEQYCYRVKKEYNEEGEEIGYWLDEDGYEVFEDVDCNTPFIDMDLKVDSSPDNFTLRLAIYDEDMEGAFIQYAEDETQRRIPFRRRKSKKTNELQYDRTDGSGKESFIIKLNKENEVEEVLYIFNLLNDQLKQKGWMKCEFSLNLDIIKTDQ